MFDISSFKRRSTTAHSPFRRMFSSRTFLIILFVSFFLLRAIYPLADPPKELSWSLGLFFDEGIYNHNARNQVLFGQWELDEWNDSYYSMASALIKYATFRLFGTGRMQMRLISVVFSWFSLLFVYLASKESYGKKTAILAVLLLGTNYIYIMYNRLGMQDTQTLAIFTITWYFWQKGILKLRSENWRTWHSPLAFFNTSASWCFLGAGISCFVMYSFKNLFLYLIPAPFVALVVYAVIQYDKVQIRTYINAFVALCVGTFTAFAIWYTTFYIHYQDMIGRIGSYMMQQRMLPRDGLKGYLVNLRQTPFFSYFSRNPIVLLVALVFLLFLCYLLFSEWRTRLHPSDLFLTAWFGAVFVFLGLLSYRPLRWFLPIIPPMCILAARCIAVLLDNVTITFPKKLHWVFYPIAIGWLSMIFYYCLIPWMVTYWGIDLSKLLGTNLLFASIGLACFLSGLIGVITSKSQYRTLKLPYLLTAIIGCSILTSSLYMDGTYYYQWVRSPEYVIDRTGKDLMGILGNHAYIGGLDAPGVAFDTSYKTLYSWPEFVNDDAPITTYQLTHLFLADSPIVREKQEYFRRYPREMQGATLLKHYTIQNTLFHLFSLVEPKILDIDIEKTEYAPDAPLQVQVDVKNYDFRRKKKLAINWYLYPVTLQDHALAAASGQEIQRWFAPNEEKKISVSGAAPPSPGRYQLLLTWKPLQHEMTEAENLRHHIGQIIPQTDASGNRAVYHDVTASPHSGFLTYGGYHSRQPGIYETGIRLKIEDNTINSPVARLDIAIKGKTIQHLELRGTDFSESDMYHNFILPYILKGYTHGIEFRVYSYGKTNIWVDEMSTVFHEGDWYQEAIIVKK